MTGINEVFWAVVGIWAAAATVFTLVLLVGAVVRHISYRKRVRVGPTLYKTENGHVDEFE